MITAPMLAAKDLDIDTAPYPLLATPKIDGFRCVKVNDTAHTRSFKEVQNEWTRFNIENRVPNGCDGEIIVPNVEFHNLSGQFRKFKGKPNFQYLVFDYVSTSLYEPYVERVEKLRQLVLPEFCTKLLPEIIKTKEELLAYEDLCLTSGYEGIMLRKPGSIYKCGRSTLREFNLVKLKRFKDAECIITGFVELQHNENEPFIDELGHTKRSTHRSGKVGGGTLGTIIGEDVESGIEVRIGGGKGFTPKLRQEIWNNRELYRRMHMTYTFQEYGTKDKPRHGQYKAFREKWDMDSEEFHENGDIK